MDSAVTRISAVFSGEKLGALAARSGPVTLLPGKTEGFSNKTILHIKTLYGSFGDNKIFGRNTVMELLGLKSS